MLCCSSVSALICSDSPSVCKSHVLLLLFRIICYLCLMTCYVQLVHPLDTSCSEVLPRNLSEYCRSKIPVFWLSTMIHSVKSMSMDVSWPFHTKVLFVSCTWVLTQQCIKLKVCWPASRIIPDTFSVFGRMHKHLPAPIWRWVLTDKQTDRLTLGQNHTGHARATQANGTN